MNPLEGNGTGDLRRRQISRLWYRNLAGRVDEGLPATRPVTGVIDAESDFSLRQDSIFPETPPVASVPELRPAFDAYLAALRGEPAPTCVEQDSSAQTPRIEDSVPIPKAEPRRVSTDELFTWRIAPAGAPLLLLSANDLLDACQPGAVLGPGSGYRILTIRNGIAHLEVNGVEGPRRGYCAAVDLVCIESGLGDSSRFDRAGARVKGMTDRLSRVLGGPAPALERTSGRW